LLKQITNQTKERFQFKSNKI